MVQRASTFTVRWHVLRCVLRIARGLTQAATIGVLCTSGCGVDGGSAPVGLGPSGTESATVSTGGASGNLEGSPDSPETPVVFSFTAGPVFCCNPLTFEFTAELSGDAFTARTVVAWDFGDARTASGPLVQHTYARAGTYVARATARLFDGRELAAERTLGIGMSDSESEPLFGADAGEDQTVLGGATVTLTGTITGELAGPEPTSSWRQVAGEGVALQDGGGARAVFSAPDPDGLPHKLTFEFQVIAGVSAADQVRVTVWPSTTPTAGNVAPVVYDANVAVADNQPTEILLEGADYNGDKLSFSVLSAPRNGTVTVLGNQGPDAARFLYSPGPGFDQADVFTFRAWDGEAFSGAGTCTLGVTGEAEAGSLLATDGAYLVAMGTAGKLTMTGQAGPTADLTFELMAPPKFGVLGPFDNRALHTATAVYTPDSGFEGTDTFEYRVMDGVSASAPAVVTLTVAKLLVPWIEVNAPTSLASDLVPAEQVMDPGMTMLDYSLAGIEQWAEVTDTVVVTTMPGQAKHLYPELMGRIPPQVRILGGIKTTRLPGATPTDPRAYDFADPVEWSAIAEEAQQIVAYTGMTGVLLENETALQRYTFGEVRIDLGRLADSLAILHESGVEYWWNLPRILPDIPEFPGRQQDTTAFVETIAAGLANSVFLGGYTAWYDWRHQLALRDTMFGILGERRIQERLLVTPDGFHRTPEFVKRCFTTDEAIERLPQLKGDAANVFPGVEFWIVVGRSFADALPPLAEPVR